ncbi:hypothetical protein P152DRAFT_262698 [Eremomyces bilateralis CBS 781.70]|uniref:MARVEL domain-containing protein n=1 Tax=Eremomyces bilateralis CBS 781.70 TaxID=1392243 RepID=A0A6G1G8E5_9PEZI|nr:uncharacterized protein P152DRAFT_262698 [Eremomyces bilateralis CBS 781.70]KAF1814170.1 hypothetical protein P152DRAFT_262698 [Eremomyces bilateralis CBS 781.70]
MIFRRTLYTFWRLSEIITLIPVIGMLAWFVHGYVESNQLTPNFILILFIVSVLAGAWALVTLFHVGHSGHFIGLVDLGFVGAFIAAVYEMRAITEVSCSNFEAGKIYINLGPFGYYGREGGNEWSVNLNKNCAMLKASFAFGIMNTLFFFFTAFLAWWMHRSNDKEVVRHSHRGSYSGSPRRSHHSRHSHRSSRRYYV